MATIRQRTKSKWEAQVRKRGWPTQTRTFATKADAQQWASEREAEMRRGTFVDTSNLRIVTVRSIMERYLAEVTPKKKGAEPYQITRGGSGDDPTSIGEIMGRGFEPDKVTDAIETIVDTYLGLRLAKDETFLEAYRRVGPQPFKDALYGSAAEAA